MKDILFDKFNNLAPKIECLDHGFVQLIDCMPRSIRGEEESADHAIAEAARCSYQRGTKTIADDKTLIRYLMRHNHTSPFEMIEFKFHCKMPMFVARQWIRHRTANVNELSGRYSEMPEECYIPEVNNFRTQSKTNHQGSEGLLEKDIAEEASRSLCQSFDYDFDLYHDLLDNGVVREQSRIVLPLSTYTEWYWKIDLKNLLHFLDLRCDSHSQMEIQVFGNAMLDLIRPIVPWTIEAWEDYSPYRGGMILTRYEVETLKKFINHARVEANLDIYPIEVKNKLEEREWHKKAEVLGLKDIDEE